jgi:ankyrin repeat protein
MDISNLTAQLFVAIERNDIVRATTLLEVGADPDGVTGPMDKSLLAHAISRKCSLGIFERLLERGADPNGNCNKAGTAILLYAIENGTPAICKLLIDRGAQLTRHDEFSENPLTVAASKGNIDMCRLLIEAGADVHRRSVTGGTVLSDAVSSNCPSVCELLIEHGADVLAEDMWGRIALHYVSENAVTPNKDPADLAKLLVRRGASPSHYPAAAPANYLTPFQYAVEKDNRTVAQYFLLHCGEDPAQRTGDDWTMPDLAPSSDMKEILRAALTTSIVARSIETDALSDAEPARSARALSPL